MKHVALTVPAIILGLTAFSSAYAQSPHEVAAIRSQMPKVTLDALAYDNQSEISARVELQNPLARPVENLIIYSCPDSGDVEFVLLHSEDADSLVTHDKIVVDSGIGAPLHGDGVLTMAPGDTFVAFVVYNRPDSDDQPQVSADFALAKDGLSGAQSVRLDAELGAIMSELNPDEATSLLISERGFAPVEFATTEVLFKPRDGAQLQEFLNRYEGEILEADGWSDLPEEQWHRISIQPREETVEALDEMRRLLGDEEPLVVASELGMQVYATVMEMWLEGYRVGINPKVQLFSNTPVQATEGGMNTTMEGGLADALGHALFDLPRVWRFMAQIDADQGDVPVAFLDQGFAPDPDHKGFPNLFEANVRSGLRGPGEAVGVPTVGNSLFGSLSWHGSNMVQAAGAVLNNGYGVRGVAGQVLRPMLYKMDLRTYAFGIGKAIRMAVDDGASVINASLGFPCRLLWTLGPDDICSAGGRALFLTKITGVITAAVVAASAVICATVLPIPIAGPILCGAIIAAAVAVEVAAINAILISVFLPENKGPIEQAVAHAVDKGVPVVASAGNRLDADDIGPLAEFVDLSVDRMTVEEWDMIPASIPGVIAVGAAQGSGFPNVNFFGDRVDIWAPIRMASFNPPDVTQADLDAGPLAHVRGSSGGTSAAAAYISGVIANLMAVNPTLDPRNQSTTGRRQIVGRVRRLLVDNAYSVGSPGVPDTAGAVASGIGTAPNPDFDRRRNLVNPFASTRAAAREVGIWDYESSGYDGDYGRRDFDKITLSFGGSVSDEIGRIDAESWTVAGMPGTGLRVNDIDRIEISYPTSPGMHRARITLRTPWHEGFGAVRLNNRNGRLQTAVNGRERVFEFFTDWQLHNTKFDVTLSGGSFDTGVPASFPAPNDSPYVMEVESGGFRSLPPQDPFEAGAGNNSVDDAVLFQADPCNSPEWQPVAYGHSRFGRTEEAAFERVISGLSIHDQSDEDWFAVDLSGCVPNDCERCPPRLWVYMIPYRPDLSIEVYDQNMNVVGRGDGRSYIDIDCDDYTGRFPLYVRVFTTRPVAHDYDLRFRWSILSDYYCCHPDSIAQHHGGQTPPWCDIQNILPIDPRLELVALDDIFKDPFDMFPFDLEKPLTYKHGIPVNACMGIDQEMLMSTDGPVKACLPLGLVDGEIDAAFDEASFRFDDGDLMLHGGPGGPPWD